MYCGMSIPCTVTRMLLVFCWFCAYHVITITDSVPRFFLPQSDDHNRSTCTRSSQPALLRNAIRHRYCNRTLDADGWRHTFRKCNGWAHTAGRWCSSARRECRRSGCCCCHCCIRCMRHQGRLEKHEPSVHVGHGTLWTLVERMSTFVTAS